MKKFNYKKLILLIIFVQLFEFAGFSQYDPLFSQYMWNEMYINPAYAGAREAISAVGLSRTQWVGIDGAPNTQTMTIHSPMLAGTVGAGLNVLHESIGVSDRIYATGVFAYRIKMKKGKLSFGLSGGVINAQEDLAKINTSEIGDNAFQVNTPRLAMPNAGFGMYYYNDRWYAGISMPRLIQNNVDELNSFAVKSTFDAKNLHYYVTGGYVFNLKKGTKIKPTIMLKNVYGAPMELDLSLNAFLKDLVWIGAAWRSGDASSAIIGLQISPKLRVGYSYDYTISKLRKYNDGSHEICIGYDFNLNNKKIVSPRLF